MGLLPHSTLYTKHLHSSFCSKLALNDVMLQTRKQSHGSLFRVPQQATQAQSVFPPKYVVSFIIYFQFYKIKDMFFMGGGLVFNFNIQMNSPTKYLGQVITHVYLLIPSDCPGSTQLKCRCSRNVQLLFPVPSPPQRRMTGNTCLLLTFLSGQKCLACTSG